MRPSPRSIVVVTMRQFRRGPTGYAARADADRDVWTAVAVAIIAIAPEPNIDLGHLEVLGLGRNAADNSGAGLSTAAASAVVRAIFIMDSFLDVKRFRASFRFVFTPRSHNGLGQLSRLRCFVAQTP